MFDKIDVDLLIIAAILKINSLNEQTTSIRSMILPGKARF